MRHARRAVDRRKPRNRVCDACRRAFSPATLETRTAGTSPFGRNPAPLKRDDFSSNRHPALAYWWSMIFSENRYPLFGIMLYASGYHFGRTEFIVPYAILKRGAP